MSETMTGDATSKPAATATAPGFRIDPPHVLVGSQADLELRVTESAETPAGEAAEPDQTPLLTVGLIQQLRSQAEQLSAHLKAQEKDLEQREEVLNARLAEVENQTRAARLWVRERQAEIHQQEEDLERRRAELDGRWTRQKETASAAMRGLPNPHELAKREASLAVAEAELQAAQDRLQADLEAFSRKRTDWLEQLGATQQSDSATAIAENDAERDTALQSALDHFLARQSYLDQAEALLAESQQQLADERHELEFQRSQHEQRVKADRRSLTIQQRETDADSEKKRQTLEAQAEKLNTRRVALDELRADLTRMHRETLEMRLVVEELWAQMAGAVPPAALTLALGQTRTRLAEQNRAILVQTEQERKELESLASRLAEQHDTLAVQRRELQSWVQAQQADQQEQAKRLADREQQLEKEDAEHHAQARAWQQERSKHQTELRKLLDQLRRPAA